MTPPKLYIKLFGTPEIIVQHENSPQTHHKLPDNQPYEILLYLLIHWQTSAPRADVSNCLNISSQLSVRIKRLRGSLQEIVLPHNAEVDTYITGTERISPLGLANCTSDLQEFEEIWEAYQSDPSAPNRRILRECLQEIDGESFLKDFENSWLKKHREKVTNTIASAKKEATLLLGTLPQPKQYFQRNEDEVEAIYKQLHASNSTHVVAISGMPGVGKTTLAARYVEQYRGKYDSVFLVNAQYSETLQTTYAQFHSDLFPETSHSKVEEKASRFLKWLQSQKNYLLVLDNLEYPSLLQKYTPSPLDGHLLITTRLDDIDNVTPLLNIECLTDTQGKEFVQLLTAEAPPQYRFNNQQALELTQHYGGLPIALETAIAHARQSKLETALYMRRLKQGNLSPNENQQQVIKDAFQAPPPHSQKVLQLIAYLAADPVSEWALRLGIPECSWVDNLQPLLSWDAVRDSLSRYSLCGFASGNYTLHRFIRQIIKDMAKEQAPHLKEDAIRVINRALPCTIFTPGSEVETDYEAGELSRRDKYLQLSSHLWTCLKYIQSIEDNDKDALHLLRKGVHYYLFLEGNAKKAQELCDQQEKLTHQLYPTLNREWVEASRLSASLNIYTENNLCANKYIVQARNYAKRLNIPHEDPTHCAILESRGFVLLRMKRYRRALPFLQAALKHAQTTNQEATILLKLGDACLNLNQFEEGEKHTLHAIKLAHTLSEQDKTPLAVGYATLGAIYTYWGNECHDKCKYALAEKALAEGIRLGETHWGDTHLFTADLLLKQGELSYYKGVKVGAKADAKKVFERVLAICKIRNNNNCRIYDSAERWLQKIAV